MTLAVAVSEVGEFAVRGIIQASAKWIGEKKETLRTPLTPGLPEPDALVNVLLRQANNIIRRDTNYAQVSSVQFVV